MAKDWTPEEIELLIANYPEKPNMELVEIVGRSYGAITSRASAMGLKKTDAYKASMIHRAVANGEQYRFKKGQEPKNKGQKMTETMYQRLKPTMFKKGQQPKNTKKEGEISIRYDKLNKPYKWIKVGNKMLPLHTILWEKEHGALPAGYNVVFKNGNTLDARIENLECISNAELMLRNSIQRYPNELQQTIKMLSKLNKIIYEKQDRGYEKPNV
jgi:hypothetical protein